MTTFSLRSQQRFAYLFMVLFYLLFIYKWLNGQFMYQLQPHFFNLHFDPFTWMFMETGIHQWLLNNQPGWILFDLAFYSMPLVWWLVWKKNLLMLPSGELMTRGAGRNASVTAVIWLIINWIYVQCYTLFPSNSIEGHIGWLFMPVLFAAGNLKSFYYLMHALRYYFLFFFATAGIWKFRQGGIFNWDQMSGILLQQHKEFLFNSPDSWYTHLIYWIVQHPAVGWSLYASATLLELSFAIGFFTRKYDCWLYRAFLLFLVMDLFIMRITYFELLPLSLPLLFSKKAEPSAEPVTWKSPGNP